MRQSTKMVLIGSLFCLATTAVAQNKEKASTNPYVKLGQKALMDGDFKSAVASLEKALPSDTGNVNIMYMLGYSQYHSGAYSEATKSFSKVIVRRPDDVSAYYYRGKSQSTLAVQEEQKISDAKRSQLLESSINDFSKAIALNGADMKLYQNRAMAYRDLGNLRGTLTSKNHDKEVATNAYNNCIQDLEVVMAKNPGRKDLSLEMKKAKVYRDNLK